MFKSDLKSRFEKIFGISKVTFSEPASFEQDTLFIEINSCKARPTKGTAYARVDGYLVLYTQAERTPYGFFAKRIEKADNALTRDLFFFEIDTEIASSPARLQNIHERRCRFVFLFKQQYDPAKGSLAGVEFDQVSFIEDGSGAAVQDGGGTPLGAPT